MVVVWQHTGAVFLLLQLHTGSFQVVQCFLDVLTAHLAQGADARDLARADLRRCRVDERISVLRAVVTTPFVGVAISSITFCLTGQIEETVHHADIMELLISPRRLNFFVRRFISIPEPGVARSVLLAAIFVVGLARAERVRA